MLKRIFIALVLIICSHWAIAQDYKLIFEEPQTHYVTVQMTVNAKGGDLELHMPVWAPGSYLVREFSKNVEAFSAKNESGKSLDVVRTRKNAWLIKSAKGKTIVSYKVYAYEFSDFHAEDNSLINYNE